MSRSTNGRIRTSGQSVRFGIQARWRKAAAVMLSVTLVCGSVVLPERTAEAMMLEVPPVNPAAQKVYIDFSLQQTQPVDVSVWVKDPTTGEFVCKGNIVTKHEFQGDIEMVPREICGLKKRALLSPLNEEESTSEAVDSLPETDAGIEADPSEEPEKEGEKSTEPAVNLNPTDESKPAEESKPEEEPGESEQVPEDLSNLAGSLLTDLAEPKSAAVLTEPAVSSEESISEEAGKPIAEATETEKIAGPELQKEDNPVIRDLEITDKPLELPKPKLLKAAAEAVNGGAAAQSEPDLTTGTAINDMVSFVSFQKDGHQWNRLIWNGRIQTSGSALAAGSLVPVYLPSGTDGEVDQVELFIRIQPLGYPERNKPAHCTPAKPATDTSSGRPEKHDHGEDWEWTREYKEDSPAFTIDYLRNMNLMNLYSLFDQIKAYLTLAQREALQNLFEKLGLDYCWLDPINMITGAYYFHYPDLELNGAYPLSFVRLYSSTDQRTGSLGKGGSHNWDYTLQETDGILQLTGPFGESAVFLRLEDGTFHTLGSSIFEVEETGSQLVLTHEEGAKLIFGFNKSSGTGTLKQAVNPQGVTVAEFSFSGSHLTRMKNQTGLIDLHWSGDQIISLSDSAGRTVTYGYDGDNLTSVENPDGDRLEYEYDANGFLTKCWDYDGNLYLENEYDEQGRVVSQDLYTEGGTSTSTITYDDENMVTTARSGDGEERKFYYDEHRNILSVEEEEGTSSNTRTQDKAVADSLTSKEGGTIQYTLDDDRNVTKAVYPDGTTVSTSYVYHGDTALPGKLSYSDGYSEEFAYDSHGNLKSHTDRSGHTITYTYNAEGLPLTMTNGAGETTRYEYDGGGRLTKETDPLNHSTSYRYDNIGRMTAMIDANGNTTAYEYSAAGKLKGITLPNRLKQSFEYTGNGFQTRSSYTLSDLGAVETAAEYGVNNAVLKKTDELGQTTSYSYDREGRLKTITNPDGGTVRYEYDKLGRLIAETDPDNRTTTYEYDQMDRPIKAVNSQSGTQTYEYDSLGRVTAYTDENGARTTYTYNIFDQVTSVTDGEGNTTCIAYTPNGNVSKEIDANGKATSYAYDAADRVIQVTDGNGDLTRYEYDRAGRMIKVTDGEGRTVSQHLDPVGNVLLQTDPGGYSTEYAYDSMNQVTQQTNPDGTTRSFTYDKAQNLLSETDEAGNLSTYTYDAKNRLIASKNPAGGSSRFTYDPMGRLIQSVYPDGSMEENRYSKAGDLILMVDPNGNRTEYEYDSLHRLKAITDPEGVETRYFYDPVGNTTQITIEGKPAASYEYDQAGFPASFTDGSGNLTRIQCDGLGNTAKVTDPRGKTTEYQYNGRYDLVKIIDAKNGTQTFAYDKSGLLISQTDQNGNTTSRGYDPRGNVTSITDAKRAQQFFEYDQRSQLVGFTDAKGNRTTYQLDPLGRLTQETDPLGQTRKYTYDAMGNRLTYADENSNITKYTYDAMNRPLTETDTNNHRSVWSYDPAGNLLSETDENKNTTVYGYDGLNRLISVKDPAGTLTEYGYNSLGLLSTVTAYGGGNSRQTTRYEYDGAGKLLKEISPTGGTTSYTYDEAGNPLEKLDPNGSRTTNTYDELNRLIHADFGDGTVADYTYDPAGKLTALKDTRPDPQAESASVEEHTAFTYDEVNRLTQVTYPDQTAAMYEYDANGNQVKMVYPDGKPVSYTYDALNRPLTMTDHDGSVIHYEYNLVGTLKRETHDNGTTTEYAYDERQQVREIQETDVDHNIQRLLSYAYDAKGNLWSETRRGVDVENRDESVSYTYDKADKLVRTTVDGRTTGYTYDPAGNLIQEQRPEGTIHYTYDEENRLRLKRGPEGLTSYEYDQAGNLIRQNGPEGSRSFEYNGRGLLSKAANETGETTEYTYNGLGVRVENIQVRDNTNTGHQNARLNKGSLYIPDYMPTLIENRYSWQRVFETEVNTVVQNDREEVHKEYKVDYTSPTSRDILVEERGSYTQRYLYDLNGKRIGAEFDCAEGTKAGEAGENPASRIAAEQVEKIYYRTSLIDSSLYAMKADGSVISHTIYDEWGEPQTETRQDMNYAGIDNMNNYTGYTYDEVMEIYFAQARFYDPVDKRFIQEDPVKDGSNWYAYCGGNPVTHVDPLGLRQEQDRFVPLRAIVEKFGGQVTSYKKSTIAAAGTRYKGARHTATVSLGGKTKTFTAYSFSGGKGYFRKAGYCIDGNYVSQGGTMYVLWNEIKPYITNSLQYNKEYRQTLSTILGFTPGLGDLKDIQEAITGVDLITGDKIRGWERIVTSIAVFLPIVSGKSVRVSIEASKIDELTDARKVEKAVIETTYSNFEDGVNFSKKAAQHMGEAQRFVPVQTLQDAIRKGNAFPDPRGSKATMYYSTMTKNGKLYNLEVLYDEATNTIYHFEYTRAAIGNLPAISK